LKDFFRSGEEYVEKVLNTIRGHFEPTFKPRRCLDFGCGVGRLSIPLALVSEQLVAADVSESMLERARRHCNEKGLRNVHLVRTDDALCALNGSFNLINSFIVFQHIPTRRGYRLAAKLLDHLEPGGIAVLHFHYARNATLTRRFGHWLRKRVPLIHMSLNIRSGLNWREPLMAMNAYSMTRLFALAQSHAIHRTLVQFTQHGDQYLGAVLFMQRARQGEEFESAFGEAVFRDELSPADADRAGARRETA
jgi:SAM-dependent methyltransferase